MTTEERLRDALHTEAGRIQPRDGWDAIESRLDERPPRRWLPYGAAAAAALVVVAAVAVIALQDDGRQPVITNPGTSTTVPVTRTTAVPVATRQQYIWPIDPAALYTTPEAMAAAFVHEFLGVADASVGAYRASDTTSGEIEVVSSGGQVISTLLAVRGSDGSWHAREALNPHLVVDKPAAGDTITSPQTISGQSVAFEGTVHVTLYGYGGDATHPVLVTTTYTGHGTEMGPYQTSISWKSSTDKWGLLMLWTDSARDGSLAEATVRLVSLSTTSALASAPSCNSDQGSGVLPSLIFIGCATSGDYLTDIRWSTWTAESATGTATHRLNRCIPDCAASKYSTYDVIVTLRDPDRIDGRLVFRTLQLHPAAVNTSGDEDPPCDAGPAPQRCTIPQDSWGFVSPS